MLSALALALAPAALPQDPSGFPPRRPVAGSHGFHAVSRVVYEGHPDRPHRLEVDCQFPARVRWRLAPEAGGARLAEYRAGARGFRLLPGAAGSAAVEGDDLALLVGRMELRRAAFFWPDGFAWRTLVQDADGPRAARMVAPLAGAPPGEAAAMHLEARGASGPGVDDARPHELVLLDARGTELERMEIAEWFAADGRLWPRRLALFARGAPAWREEVLEATANAYFLDLAFLPPDRRPAEPAAPSAEPALAVDLVPHVGRRQALPGGQGWERALASARERAQAAQRALGVESLDPALTLELDAEGRPCACWLRLAPARAAEPPAGWQAVPERPGLLARLERPEQAAERLPSLLAHLPEGTRAGAPYVRGYGPESDPDAPVEARRWELVVPLERTP